MNEENRLIGIHWNNNKNVLNNWSLICNKSQGVIILLETTLLCLILIGDYFIFDSNTLISIINKYSGIKQGLIRALMDNLSHMFIGVLSWLIISYPKINTNEIILAAFCSSIIDIDHFIAARSFKLNDAISLANRPFLHNSLTLLIVNLILFILLIVFFNSKAFNWSIIFFIAWFSHHIRDANRRGIWFGSVHTTKPIKTEHYLIILLIGPLFLRFLNQNQISKNNLLFISKINNQTKSESHIV
jgi:hypothetical protein